MKVIILLSTDLETRAKKSSKDILKDLEVYVTSQKSKSNGGGPGIDLEGLDGNEAFLNVVKSPAELY